MNTSPSNRPIPGSNDANRDPITGTPGAHPVGTGLGAAAGGAVAGAAIGTFAGPIGTAIGAAAGAVVGGLAGKAAGEAANPTDPAAEDAYWARNYQSRPYAAGTDYDTLRPAYRYGWESAGRGDTFDDTAMSGGWEKARGQTNLGWDKAKFAARDAWDRARGSRRDDTDYTR